MEKTYEIEGMKCQGCATKVTERFNNISGVENVDVNLENKTATVSGNFDENALKESLSDTHYSVK